MWKLIPQDVEDALQYEILRHDLEYDDNHRAYRIRDNKFFEEFEAAAEEGCCGSFECKILDEKGDMWMVGCNYGH